MHDIAVVVAHCQEDLHWIPAIFNKYQGVAVKVYSHACKRSETSLRQLLASIVHGSDLEVIRIPNVGREASAYLTHITREYNHLAKWTVFLQGDQTGRAPHQFLRGRRGYWPSGPRAVCTGSPLDVNAGQCRSSP